jgi:SAM-dependent methyltransferase
MLSPADHSLLDHCRGSVLDIGCGPGRLTAALVARHHRALGIDVAPSAVALTRSSGGDAVQISVFDSVPDAGQWDTALLADGNIGIGGDPVQLLSRVAELVRRGGSVLVEVGGCSPSRGCVQVRLEESGGRIGSWFPWAEVGLDEVAGPATAAGLRPAESWSVVENDCRVRHFARLEVPDGR